MKLKVGDTERGTQDELELKGRKNLKFRGKAGTLKGGEIKKAFSKMGIKVKGSGFFY